jgi:hypothetical protein
VPSPQRHLAWANIVAEQAIDRDITTLRLCSRLPLRTAPSCACVYNERHTAGEWLKCLAVASSLFHALRSSPDILNPQRQEPFPTVRRHSDPLIIEMCLDKCLNWSKR